MEHPRECNGRGATLRDQLISLPQHLLPHHPLSWVMHRLTRIRTRPLKNGMIRWFIRHYGVDMSAARAPHVEHYAHFNDFFTRAFRPEARPIATDDSAEQQNSGAERH